MPRSIARGNYLTAVLLVALPTFIWFLLCQWLRPDWQLNPQYAHGTFVPLLMILLCYRRWQDRPALPDSSRTHQTSRWPILLILLTLALLPTQILLQANPDWRVPYWIWAILAIGISLTCLAHLGGLSWATHFAPALALMLFAVPWPSLLEQQINASLLGVIVLATSEILNLLGLAVVRSGNTLIFAQGQLGIEDACSGIRSLHGSLMIGYILGELGRWPWARRFLLLAASIAIAILFNGIRATILGWRAVNHGVERAEAWHDPLSLLLMILTFVLLSVIYSLLERKPTAKTVSSNLQSPSTSTASHPMASWGVVASFFLVGSFVMASEHWFESQEPSLSVRQLEINWSATNPSVIREEVPYRARTLLRYSEGNMSSWQTPKGIHCTAYVFRWDRDRISLFNACHRPEICLPSVGLQLIGSTEPVTVTTSDGTKLVFQGDEFQSLNQRIYVWFGVWDHNLQAIDLDAATGSRLRNTWERKRVQSRQSIELILTNSAGWSEAKTILQAWAERAIIATSSPNNY